MLYYKVRPECDGLPIIKRRVIYGVSRPAVIGEYEAGELLTEHERNNVFTSEKVFEKIDIPRGHTYSFGTRFQF